MPETRENSEELFDKYRRELARNRRLQEENQRQKDEFTQILEISKSIISELDLDKVAGLVASRVRELVQAETVILPLINEDRRSYTYKAAVGLGAEDMIGKTMSIHVGMCGWVLQNEKVLLFGEPDQWWMPEKTPWEEGQQSALLVPLFGKNQIIGGLSALGKQGGGSFTEHDLDLVTIFAGQVSVALENARLFRERQAVIHELAQEVEERTRMQTVLQESEKKYRSLIETTDTGYVIVDEKGTVLDANDEYVHLSGHQRLDEILGRSVIEWTAEYDCERNAAEVKKCFEKGSVRNLEVDYVDHNQKITPVEINATVVEEKAGPIILTMIRDLTERKKTEQEIAREKERLAVTLRSIGDGVICTDTSGIITLINKIAEDLTGWSQADAVGRPLDEVFNIINERTRKICEDPVKKVLRSGKIVGLANHTAIITRDGKECSIADSGAPIRDQSSEVIGVVLVFRDITAQNRMEAELLKIRKLESVGVLAGGIAHDFNNILAAILGNINLALLDSELRSETRHLLTEAEKASLRAKGLTQQLLTFAKGGEPVKEIASLQDIVRDSADFIMHGSNIACKYRICEDLWPVEVDRSQISQVVQNIVLNARHAMPEGGTITIYCENMPAEADKSFSLADGLYVKLVITDTGIGIPENIVDKIFDPYFTTKQEGSGLGLAISHSIISKHNGQISVRSEPGQGTTFTFYLPAVPPQPEDEGKNKAAAIHTKSAKIIIMDDEEMVRKVVCAMLNQLGHKVMEAGDGIEAIRLYREAADSGASVDLIVMDLTIPGGMGGVEAVKEILAINPEAKVIVSSGYSTDPILANFSDYGFCGAVVKPYQLQELSKVVSRIIA